MTLADGAAAPACSAERPSGRRFYIHQDSFRALVTAHPGWYDDVVDALVLSAASRAVALAVQDAQLFGSPRCDAVLAAAASLDARAAVDLAGVFQSLVHFDPPDSVEPLLAKNERIAAWCYEGGYFTYATDETSAQTMYLETGSLRDLRRQIRHDPLSDPHLKMISGPSLFVVDQRLRAGRGKVAADYRAQHRRLVRAAWQVDTTVEAILGRLGTALDDEFERVEPAEARELKGECVRHAAMTLRVLGAAQEIPPLDDVSCEVVPAVAAT